MARSVAGRDDHGALGPDLFDACREGNHLAPRPLGTSRLEKHVQAIDSLVAWQHAQWGHHDRSFGPEERGSFLRSLATPQGIPACFVVHAGSRLEGSANIVDDDLPNEPRFEPWRQLSPWLASVYVDQTARGLGAGGLIVRSAQHEAAVAGCSRLYLYTPDKMSFYERLGWQRLGENRETPERPNSLNLTSLERPRL